MNFERNDLCASKGQNALVGDSIAQLFSDVSIVIKAPCDELQSDEKEGKAPQI